MFRRSRRTAVPTLALAAAAAPLAAGAAAPPAQARQDRVERQLIRLINGARHHRGKGSLRTTRRMNVGADRHSRSMARSGVMTHGAWYSRIPRFAGTRNVGEVVAYVGMSPRRQAGWVFRAWMHSPAHYAVIMSGRFHRAGVARRYGHGVTFFTVDTAR